MSDRVAVSSGREGREARWTIYVCDKGHVDSGSRPDLVCWACYPGGKRTWEPGQPRQMEGNQERVVVVPVVWRERAERAERERDFYQQALEAAEARLYELRWLISSPGSIAPSEVWREALRIIDRETDRG